MFCTNCGQTLGEAAQFCTNCGTKSAELPRQAAPRSPRQSTEFSGSLSKTFFSNRDSGGDSSARSTPSSYCILLTNTELLRVQLKGSYADLERRIETLVNPDTTWVVKYLLLDVANTFIGSASRGDWMAHVSLLKAAVDYGNSRLSGSVESAVLIGDHEIIPMPCLDNLTGADDDVDTDYPYAALSSLNPWENLLPRLIAVGRLPAGSACGSSVTCNYLDNLSRARRESLGPVKPYGLSAEVWEQSSRATYATFGAGGLCVSPPVHEETVGSKLSRSSNLLFFNLHGSNDDDEAKWYGESSARDFVAAFSPANFTNIDAFNLVGVEACYGARFTGLRTDQSSLLTALGHRTLGILGASRIAFGPAAPPTSLADVMVGGFLGHVAGGKSLGVAHMLSAAAMMDDAADDTHARLTVLEFNLFGDPNFTPFPPAGKQFQDIPTPDPEGQTVRSRWTR